LDKIRQASKKLAAETPQRVEMIVLRTVRNDTELVQALKELCAFRCQFPGCGTRIPKKEGGYYIEVAHVRPIAEGGTSVLGNLVVLCPNHPAGLFLAWSTTCPQKKISREDFKNIGRAFEESAAKLDLTFAKKH